MVFMDKFEEAILWKEGRKGIKCRACFKYCTIEKNEVGFCRVRKNIGKKLVSLNFGKLEMIEKNKIESLPIYHFNPGIQIFKISSIGTNLKGRIGFEENYEKKLEKLKEYEPENLIKKIKNENAKGIAFLGTRTSDPFVYPEFAFRCSRLAHRVNIKTIYVTNGFGSEEAIKKLFKYMDCALILIYEFCDEKFYKSNAGIRNLERIYETILQLKKQRVFVEIGNFIISDSINVEKCKELISWIINELGSEIPFHLLPFNHEISIQVFEKVAEIIKASGLRYVYINHLQHPLNNTFCYNCLQKVIERKPGKVVKFNLRNGRCTNCGFKINVLID